MCLVFDLLNTFLVYANSLETGSLRLAFHRLGINEMEVH